MTRMKSTFLASLAILLSPMAANADPITYEVDLVVGAGTVQGTITTNGVQGDVFDADITAFSLMISDGVDSFTVDNFNGFISGDVRQPGLLTATMTELLFDFSLPGAGFLAIEAFLVDSIGGFALQNGGGLEGAAIYHFDLGFDFFHEELARDLEGMYVVGTVASVPEPGTLALLGIGLFGMGLARRRKTI